MVCCIRVIYICLVPVAEGRQRRRWCHVFHPLMCGGDTFLLLFSLRDEDEKGQMKDEAEIQSQPDAVRTPVRTSVLVGYETGENHNTVGATQDARVKEVGLVPCSSARTRVALF